MTARKTAALITLTQVALAAEEARMAALRRQEQALLEAMDRLTATSRVVGDDDPAWKAGMDLRWMLWAEQQKERLRNELALLRSRIEDQRAGLAHVFGRDMAARQVHDQAVAEALQRKKRRITYPDG